MNKIKINRVEKMFGYEVVVYDYLNHEKYKDSIVDTARSFNTVPIMGNTHYGKQVIRHRTGFRKNPFFSSDNEGVSDLKQAYYEALNHFYSDVLGYEFCDENDKPQINQSWVMDYAPHAPPNNEGSYPLAFHTHFLSFVCGCYYPLFTDGHGGELLFFNPSSSSDSDFAVSNAAGGRQSLHTNFMREFETRCSKINKFEELHLKEGQIVLWYGVLPHGAMPSTDPKNRMSIVVNTSPTIVTEKRGNYQYRIEPNFSEGTGAWKENSLDK